MSPDLVFAHAKETCCVVVEDGTLLLLAEEVGGFESLVVDTWPVTWIVLKGCRRGKTVVTIRRLVVSGAIGGLVFLPLLAGSVSLYDLVVPDVSLADPEFAAELVPVLGTLRGVAFLWALTGIAFLSFVGAVHIGSERPDDGDKLASVALVAGGLWALTWIFAGLVLDGVRSIELSAESASQAKTALTIARNLSFSHDLLLAAVFVGAAPLATAHRDGAGGLIRKSGLAAAVGLILGSLTLAIGQPFPILPLGMLLLLIWTVATSVLLIRSEPKH